MPLFMFVMKKVLFVFKSHNLCKNDEYMQNNEKRALITRVYHNSYWKIAKAFVSSVPK